MLTEFGRVVRPEGLVAVKELDLTIAQYYPFDPTMIWRLFDTVRHKRPQVQGNVRTIQLPTWFKQAGFINVGFKTFLSERKPPLRPSEQAYFSEKLKFHSKLAESVDLPEQDMLVWRKLANLDSPNHILKHPDFYLREGHIVVVGQAP